MRMPTNSPRSEVALRSSMYGGSAKLGPIPPRLFTIKLLGSFSSSFV